MRTKDRMEEDYLLETAIMILVKQARLGRTTCTVVEFNDNSYGLVLGVMGTERAIDHIIHTLNELNPDSDKAFKGLAEMKRQDPPPQEGVKA